MPIKCPVAPLEFCFLADWYLRERGVRDDVEITFVTPLDAAFTKPVAAERARRAARAQGHRGGDRVRDRPGRRRERQADQLGRARGRLRPARRRSRCTAARPTSRARRDSATTLGFVRPTRTRCRAKAAPNVFAIGDATNVPTSKAGSVDPLRGRDARATNIAASSPARSWRAPSTVTPTASSRPAFTRRC